jgi:hypothetical protein
VARVWRSLSRMGAPRSQRSNFCSIAAKVLKVSEFVFDPFLTNTECRDFGSGTVAPWRHFLEVSTTRARRGKLPKSGEKRPETQEQSAEIRGVRVQKAKVMVGKCLVIWVKFRSEICWENPSFSVEPYPAAQGSNEIHYVYMVSIWFLYGVFMIFII